MKGCFNIIILLLFSCSIYAQVPKANNLVKIHSVTTLEMNAIESPLEGSLVYNTNENTTFEYNGSNWVKFRNNEENKTVILNRDGGDLPTQLNTFFDLPVSVSDIQYINSDYFIVKGVGEVTVLKEGNYLISGELSTTNMPSGSTKYILAVFVNGARRGYLSRGFGSLPNSDYWGTTGVIMYRLNANDVVSIKYVLNADGVTLNANFLNIGITKL